MKVDEPVLDYIEIRNRKDSSCDRTSQVEVRIGNFEIDPLNERTQQIQSLQRNALCGEWPNTAQCGELFSIYCVDQRPGSWVTIVIKDPKVKQMNIAEVRVYGNGMIERY